MGFQVPQANQVIFRNSPLTQVICQIRVPAILSIQERVPADFQERIRQLYPNLRRDQGVALEDRSDDKGAGPILLPPLWRFCSTDEQWTVALAPDFLALECAGAYESFDGFLSRLMQVFDAYIAVYSPTIAERIGLRYVNQLSTPEGAGGEYWIPRLQPLYTSAFSCEVIEKDPTHLYSEIRAKDEDAETTIRYAYISSGNGTPAKFVLDYDRYESGQLPLETLDDRLRQYNEHIFQLFMWSIRGPLPNELGLSPVEG